MQSANWVSAENGLCVVQTTEINEFGTGSIYPKIEIRGTTEDTEQFCSENTFLTHNKKLIYIRIKN